MMNMQNMMKQAQKLQNKCKPHKKKLPTLLFGKAAQDLVIAEFSGDRKLTNLTIKSDVIDPEDPETLQDLVADAVNDALTQIEKLLNKNSVSSLKDSPSNKIASEGFLFYSSY